jgi:hypothetical protein
MGDSLAVGGALGVKGRGRGLRVRVRCAAGSAVAACPEGRAGVASGVAGSGSYCVVEAALPGSPSFSERAAKNRRGSDAVQRGGGRVGVGVGVGVRVGGERS